MGEARVVFTLATVDYRNFEIDDQWLRSGAQPLKFL